MSIDKTGNNSNFLLKELKNLNLLKFATTKKFKLQIYPYSLEVLWSEILDHGEFYFLVGS
jgi:hypothetical protein